MSILTTVATIPLLTALHVLNPNFRPPGVVSEHAFGHYAWVLPLMFLSWGISSWALVAATWSEVHTKAGKVGSWLLIIAGIGEAMASTFDVRHEIGHGIAGLLGVIGFPIAALLVSVALPTSRLRIILSPALLMPTSGWLSPESSRLGTSPK